jgi:hypothetical protein
MALAGRSSGVTFWQACGEDTQRAGMHLLAPPTFGVLMIEGMSRAEILESLPEGFCDDCWQQSLDRRQQFSTDPETDYRWVYYVTHIWDGI